MRRAFTDDELIDAVRASDSLTEASERLGAVPTVITGYIHELRRRGIDVPLLTLRGDSPNGYGDDAVRPEELSALVAAFRARAP